MLCFERTMLNTLIHWLNYFPDVGALFLAIMLGWFAIICPIC